MKALKFYVLMPRYIMINTLDIIQDTPAQVPKKKVQALPTCKCIAYFRCLGQFVVIVQTMAHRSVKKMEQKPMRSSF